MKRHYSSSPWSWTPLATLLLRNAPDPQAMLLLIVKRLYKGFWESRMNDRLTLIESLEVGDEAALLEVKREALVQAKVEIEYARRTAAESHRHRGARFE